MNRKNKIYTQAPKNVSKTVMEGEIIAVFLPSPEKLIKEGTKD